MITSRGGAGVKFLALIFEKFKTLWSPRSDASNPNSFPLRKVMPLM